jgi:septal ring factor EnvC (AmiA/AmiB activator)
MARFSLYGGARRWLACWALLAAFGPPAQAPAASVRQTESELKSIREQIEKISREVSHDALERDQLSKSLRAAELSVGEARQSLTRLQQEQAERGEARATLERDRQAEQSALERERAALAAQLRVAYMIGQTEPLKLLLNQQHPTQAQRMFSYYGYFSRARAGQIHTIEQHVSRIEELDAKLAAEQSRLQSIGQEQKQKLAQLEQRRGERAQVLASLQSQAQAHEVSLQRLKSQQADLEKLLTELSHTLRNAPPPDNATAFGRLRGQLEWPVAGHVVASFGALRASSVRWDGVVIATERAAPVKAISAGRVIYADWLPGLGLLAIIDHGEGYLSLYGYNDQLRVHAGDSVAAGAVIAAAGDTGGRSEPQLYLQIRHEGHPVDPELWFRHRTPG